MNKTSLNKMLIIIGCIVLAIVFSVGVKTAIDYKNNDLGEERTFGDFDTTQCTTQTGFVACPGGGVIRKSCTSFEPCPAGSYCQSCVENKCPAGRYCTVGNTLGTLCPKGHYCPNVGMTYPITCPDNQYQDQTGSTSCKTCDGKVSSDKTSCIKHIGITVSANYYEITVGDLISITTFLNYEDDTTEDVTSLVSFGMSGGIVSNPGAGYLKGEKEGETYVTVNYKGYQEEIAVIVSPKETPTENVNKVVIDGPSILQKDDFSYLKLWAYDINNNATDVSNSANWSSNNSNIVTVSKSGGSNGAIVDAINNGTAVITACYGDKCDTHTIEVRTVDLKCEKTTIYVGTETICYLTKNGVEITSGVSYQSNGESVFKVNSFGEVTGVGVGEATLTATYDGESYSEYILVNGAPTIEVNCSPTTIRVGETTTCTAKVDGKVQSTGIEYIVGGTGRADVNNATGVITGSSPGTIEVKAWYEGVGGKNPAVITIKSADKCPIDMWWNDGDCESCGGVVNSDQSECISFYCSPDWIGIGEKSTCTVTVTKKGIQSTGVTYKIDNTNVANISNSGVVTGVSKGTATITATYNGTEIEASVIVAEKIDPKISFLTTGRTRVYNGRSFSLTAMTESDGKLSYTYYDKPNCSGSVLSGDPINAGNYSVKATTEETKKYHAGTSECVNLNIIKYEPNLTISPTTHSILSGSSSTLAASVTTIDVCKGTLTSKSNNTNLIKITGNANISDVITSSKAINYQADKTNIGNTNIDVTFNPTDTQNCEQISASSKITVREPEITNLALNKKSVTIKTNGVVYLNAIISKEDGTTKDVTFDSIWGSNDQTIATATGGRIEGKKEGTTTVQVSFSEIVNGKKVTFSRSVNVNVEGIAVAPTITFNDKTTSYTGSPIAHTASTNSDGKITHTYYQGEGCSGGILNSAPTNVGKYSVRVTIDESANYLLATKCVNLTIKQYEPSMIVTPVSNPVKLGEANSMFVTISTIEACKGTLTATSKNTNNVKITSNANNTDVASSGKIIGFKGMNVNSGTDIEVSFKPNDNNNCKAPQVVSQKVIVENPGVENTTLAISCNPTTLYLNSAVAGSTSCSAYFTDTNYDVTNQSSWYVNGNLVNERGSFKPTATGEYTISVSHTDGAGDIHKAKININVLPELEEPMLTFDNKTAVYNGNPITHSATSNSDGTITYIYYSDKNCNGSKLSSAPTNAGNYSVKAIQDRTSKFDAASKCANLTITKYTPTLLLNPASYTLTVGNSSTLAVNITTIYACRGTLTATSANTNNVQITSNESDNDVTSNKVIGYKGLKVNSGTNINVSFKPNDTNNCNIPSTSTSKIIVESASIDVTSISLDKTFARILKGNNLKINATVTAPNGANKTVYWESNNEKVAKVDSDGKVTALDVGTTIITATAGSKSASASITVYENGITITAVNSISLDKNTLSLVEGDTSTLIATISPSNATDKTVTWSSSNPSVATVDSNGKISALSKGTASIKAEAGGKEAICLVTVSSRTIEVLSITLNASQVNLSVGDYYNLITSILPVDATNKTITWSSSDESVITVSNGKVYAKSAGTATVTAQVGNKKASCKFIVSNVSATSVSLNVSNIELKVNETSKLIASIMPANTTNKTLSWSILDSSVAIVDNNGNVTAKAVGTTTITVQTSNNKSATATVKVIAANASSIDVTSLTKTGINTSNKLTMNIGDTLDLAVLTNPSNATNKAIAWKTSDSSYVSVSGNGLTARITAKKATVNDIVVTATSSNGKSVEWLVEVKPNKVLTLFPDTISLKVNEKGVIKPLINGQEEDANKFNWNITSGTNIVSVDSNGIVTAKANGTAKVKVTLKDNSSVSAICTINVSGNLSIDVIDIYKIGSNTSDVLTMNVNDTLGLQVELNPKDATNQKITWTTSDSNYVSISSHEKGATITAKKITTNNIVIKATASNGASVEWHVSVIGNAITNKPELYSLSLVGNDYIELNKSVDIKAIVNATGGSIDLDWSIIEGKDYAKITKKGDIATVSLTSNAKVNDTIVIKVCGVGFSNVCNTHTLTVKDISNNDIGVVVPSTGTNMPIIIVGSIVMFTVFGGALILNYRKKFN